MKYLSNCPVKGCSFEVRINVNSYAECVEARSQFKRHLQTHSQDELTDTIFKLVMAFEGDK